MPLLLPNAIIMSCVLFQSHIYSGHRFIEQEEFSPYMEFTNMSFLDNLISAGKEKIKEMVINAPVAVPLPQSIINNVITKLLLEDEDIYSLTLAMHEGWFGTETTLKHRLGTFFVQADFEILRFQLDQSAQIIELKQRGKLEVGADGWLNRIAFIVVKSVLSALLGKTLIEWGVKDRKGITVADDLIRVDLTELGAKDLLMSAVSERAGALGKIVGTMLSTGSDKLAKRLSIVGAQSHDGVLHVNLKYTASDENSDAPDAIS
jgi:hypothetical protein